MPTSTLINGAVVIAVIIYMIYRKFTWTEIISTEVWGTPATLIIIGVLQFRHLDKVLKPADIVIIVLGVAFSLIGGAVMGLATQLRKEGDKWYQKVGKVGLVAWVILTLSHVAIEALGHVAGAEVASSGSVMMLTMGVNTAALTFILNMRTGGVKPPARGGSTSSSGYPR
ncbi:MULTISPECIES: hypothetical protein [unclassified Nocardia]|uniref:hypothetical protein n=1 Tax=unclassified Nocardia TaxID=2637762 RepID=UPI001CE44FDE|nr:MULTISPECIES: hypothetical protein [unclassified Nocardia]